MQYSLLTLLGLGSLGLLTTSCAKNDTAPTTECTHLATVIGYNPCSTTGYVLALDSPRDTVNCFNLPEGLLPTTLNVSRSGRGDGLFADSTFVHLKIGYTVLAPSDRTASACRATIYLGRWFTMTKGEEIKVLCATKSGTGK